jgi:hypothetical protein
VDEKYRLALAALAVSERRSVNLGCAYALQARARHVDPPVSLGDHNRLGMLRVSADVDNASGDGRRREARCNTCLPIAHAARSG